MCQPSAQAYLATERFDDHGIGSEDRLARHCRTPVQFSRCAINGYVLSDRAFAHKRAEGGTSADLECLLTADGHPADFRYGAMPRTYGLVAVTAGDARTIGAGAAWTPKPEQPELEGGAASANPWHGEIIG